jgi:CRP/FNR family transcriptional regulator
MHTSMQETWHLRNVDLFTGLKPEDLQLVHNIFREARYQRGELLYMIDEPAERLFFLQSGIVKLAVVTLEGDEKVIDIFQPGDVFGQMFLSKTRRYAYQAEALEEVTVNTLTQEGFKALMKACPDVCIKLVRHMVEHHRHTMSMLETLIRTDASHRLLRVLINLGDRQGQAGRASFRLHSSLTQEDLANMTGLNRTTVSLLINDFRRRGILGGQGREIIINRDAVQSVLELDRFESHFAA